MPRLTDLRRPLLGLVLAATAVGCGGGDSGTGPALVPPVAPAVQPLSLSATTVTPYTSLIVGVRGVVVPETGVVGAVGSVAVTGARLTDTSMAILVPVLPVGPRDVKFTVGAVTFASTVQVSAVPVVTGPRDIITSFLARQDAVADTIDAHIKTAATQPIAGDTTAMRRLAVAQRARIADARVKFAALTDAEAAAAASIIVANPALLDELASPAAAGTDRVGSGLVASPQLVPAAAARDIVAVTEAAWVDIKANLGACLFASRKKVAFVTVVGLFAGGPVGAALGAAIGGALSVGVCLYQLEEGVMTRIMDPIVTEAGTWFETGSSGSLGMTGGLLQPGGVSRTLIPATFTSGVPQRVTFTVRKHSLSAADAKGPPAIVHLLGVVDAVRAQWDSVTGSLVDKSIAPAWPGIPATPAVRVRVPVPVENLRLGAVTPVAVTGTTGGSGSNWDVTFRNDLAGATHPFEYTVAYTPDGAPAETHVFQGVLQPKAYGAASISISNMPPTIAVGGTVALTAVVRDSVNRVLGADELVGRTPHWSTADAKIATVNEATGVVTGVSAGSVVITVAETGMQGSITVTVAAIRPDSVAEYTAALAGSTLSVTAGWANGDKTYRLVLNADGTGQYSVPGQAGIAQMRWRIQARDGYHWFVDEGYWAGPPVYASLEKYPPTTFTGSAGWFPIKLTYKK